MTNIPDWKSQEMSAPPEWLDAEAWEQFYKMRMEMWRTRRIPFNRYAQHLILKKLERFRDLGYDPNLCLKDSIECGYRGVFERGERRQMSFDTQRTWKPARVNYSADDCEYYKKFYMEHPDLMPEGWKQ